MMAEYHKLITDAALQRAKQIWSREQGNFPIEDTFYMLPDKLQLNLWTDGSGAKRATLCKACFLSEPKTQDITDLME
jgi:hypothetical protein